MGGGVIITVSHMSVSQDLVSPEQKASLTAAQLRVEVLVDGVERILLLAAMLPGSEDVPHTLVKEGVLALQHTRK